MEPPDSGRPVTAIIIIIIPQASRTCLSTYGMLQRLHSRLDGPNHVGTCRCTCGLFSNAVVSKSSAACPSPSPLCPSAIIHDRKVSFRRSTREAVMGRLALLCGDLPRSQSGEPHPSHDCSDPHCPLSAAGQGQLPRVWEPALSLAILLLAGQKIELDLVLLGQLLEPVGAVLLRSSSLRRRDNLLGGSMHAKGEYVSEKGRAEGRVSGLRQIARGVAWL